MENEAHRKHPILAKLKHLFSQMLKSRLFMQNLLFIGSVMLLLFFAFAIITYNRSARILREEFASSSENQLEMTAQSVDTYMKDMRYLIATLDQNSLVQAFFSYRSPEYFYNEYETRLRELLSSCANSDSTIDSIYLYSELTGQVMTANYTISASNLTDNGWMDYLTEDAMSERIIIFPRSKNTKYPYLLCMMKPLERSGKKAAIVLNLNLSKVSYLRDVNSDPYREIFLVTDNKDVLYSFNQRDLLVPLDRFSRLNGLQDTSAICSTVVSDVDEPYILTQLHSADYPWYYVSITNLAVYTDRLSSNSTFLLILFTILLVAVIGISFLFSIRSTKPIHEILLLLNNQSARTDSESHKQNEVKYISDQIVSYAQQNKELSEELAVRLNLLNETQILALQSQINPHFLFNTLNMIYTCECEELGFQSEIPNMTLKLSRLLRYAMESTDLVSLSTELDFTKSYLELMRQRHNNRFQIDYEVDPDVMDFQVPKLVIQPIAENAIFHGLSTSQNPDNRMTLQCKLVNGMCEITVTDNGIGMDAETLHALRNIADEKNPHSTSIGLRNVVIRMKLLYGSEFSMTIDSQIGEGSTFTMKFPPLSHVKK